MPRHHRIDIVALIVTLFCTLGLAAPAEKPIDRLLDLSGVTKQVGEMPEQVKAGFIQGVQQGNPIPETIALLVLHGADKTILPSVVLDEIRVSVENALTPGEIRTLLSWYESDVGKRITTAEEKASTPEAYTEMLQDAQSLLGQTGRVEVAERLDALLGATELYMDLQEFSSTASYTAMMSVMAPEEPLNLEAFNAQWDAMARERLGSAPAPSSISTILPGCALGSPWRSSRATARWR